VCSPAGGRACRGLSSFSRLGPRSTTSARGWGREPASDRGTGFRAVAHDRLFLILIAANIVLVMTGGALFSNLLAPFARAHTPVGPGEIGVVFFINTFFIVVAQIPATRVVKRMRRTHALAATSALLPSACSRSCSQR
jgi:cytochrome c biogenesis factor